MKKRKILWISIFPKRIYWIYFFGISSCPFFIREYKFYLYTLALQDSGRIAATVASSGSKQATTAPTATKVALDILRRKGFSGLYQGGVSTLVRDVFFSAIYFPLFAFFNSKVKHLAIFLRAKIKIYYYDVILSKGKLDPKTNKPLFYHTFASGILAGSIGAYIATPLDGKLSMKFLKLTA